MTGFLRSARVNADGLQDEDLAAGIRSLKFLVIDEADRMIENGHFAELETIVRLTQRASK